MPRDRVIRRRKVIGDRQCVGVRSIATQWSALTGDTTDPQRRVGETACPTRTSAIPRDDRPRKPSWESLLGTHRTARRRVFCRCAGAPCRHEGLNALAECLPPDRGSNTIDFFAAGVRDFPHVDPTLSLPLGETCLSQTPPGSAELPRVGTESLGKFLVRHFHTCGDLHQQSGRQRPRLEPVCLGREPRAPFALRFLDHKAQGRNRSPILGLRFVHRAQRLDEPFELLAASASDGRHHRRNHRPHDVRHAFGARVTVHAAIMRLRPGGCQTNVNSVFDERLTSTPDSRRPHSEKWGLTCGFVGGGGRI